ncbi:MAG: YdaU family protein [Caldilineaceae bacterium]
MNYYERHIGDYLKDTAHLSLLEHGVYGRLLDVYYTREGAIPAAQVERLVGARTKDEKAALAVVLSEFFDLVCEHYTHSRCEREIARLNDKRCKAAASANARWSKQGSQTERNANAMRTHSEGNAPSHQTPDTSHQETPPTPGKRGSAVHSFPPGFDVFWKACPRKTAKAKAAKAFARLKPDEALLAVMLQALAVQSRSEQWTKDGGQFIPHPATWINERRWEDEGMSVMAKNDPFAGAA